MRRFLTTVSILSFLPVAAVHAQEDRAYRWVDENGIVHYGDTLPPNVAELEKQVLNEQGITVDVMRGKKTEEELAAERRQLELEAEREVQRRADAALLATYLSVDEIIMHRDRRVELFQAQAKVTELYLRNLRRRLGNLEDLASKYRPYSEDPDAEMIDPGLSSDINETKAIIARNEQNLDRFRQEESAMAARFDGDIVRFKELKGLN